MALLRVEKVEKAYSRRRVVDGVSLDVDPGEIVGLLGRNGAGKTTTFRMVIGLVRPDQGKIFFNGTDVSPLPIYRRARLGMGFLPQETSIFQRLTVSQNVLAVLELRKSGAAERKTKCADLLETYGLTRLGDQKAFTLSGGERRRLEICRAMALEPSILLLDEPFAAVDPITVADLQGVIRSLKDRSVGVLLTDHSVRETLAITDRSYIIDDGKLLAHGAPGAIVENEAVREKYLGKDFRL